MPKLLYFITEDWYFCSHRLPLARAAIEAGYEVSILTRIGDHREMIESAGIRIIPLKLQRRSLNPFRELISLLSIIRVYHSEKPDIVHHVAMKPVLYGSIAALLNGIPRVVNAFAGLGFLFASDRMLARLLRPLVTVMFRFILNQGASQLILQNPDDRRLLLAAGVVEPERIALIKGAGVDVTNFKEYKEPVGPITIILASRLIWDKGVGEFVEASSILLKSGLSVKLVLVGDADPENPRSIPNATLLGWQKQGLVEWWGRRSDMPDVLSQAHIVCLPSAYGEGIPKVLIEAAACGRPIVTTDTPGCREIVKHGANGLLIPVKDSKALADALQLLIENPVLRRQMGTRGREMVVQEFAVEKIISETLTLYKSQF